MAFHPYEQVYDFSIFLDVQMISHNEHNWKIFPLCVFCSDSLNEMLYKKTLHKKNSYAVFHHDVYGDVNWEQKIGWKPSRKCHICTAFRQNGLECGTLAQKVFWMFFRINYTCVAFHLCESKCVYLNKIDRMSFYICHIWMAFPQYDFEGASLG